MYTKRDRAMLAFREKQLRGPTSEEPEIVLDKYQATEMRLKELTQEMRQRNIKKLEIR